MTVLNNYVNICRYIHTYARKRKIRMNICRYGHILAYYKICTYVCIHVATYVLSYTSVCRISFYTIYNSMSVMALCGSVQYMYCSQQAYATKAMEGEIQIKLATYRHCIYKQYSAIYLNVHY